MTYISADQMRMNEVVKETEDLYTQVAALSGLSDSAFDILYALEAYGEGCTQKELCERCFIGKQTVNSSVKRLEQQGIIARNASGRNTRITLTEAGRRLVESKVVPIIIAEGRAMDSLSQTDREQLLALSERYRDALRDAFAQTQTCAANAAQADAEPHAMGGANGGTRQDARATNDAPEIETHPASTSKA